MREFFEQKGVRAWLWAIAITLHVFYFTSTSACGGLDKPIVQPNPDFANCEAAKSQRENECLIEAGTRVAFDDCIARVRKSCVDGGAK